MSNSRNQSTPPAPPSATAQTSPSPDPGMARGDRDEPRSDTRPGDNRAFSTRDWEQANAPTDPERRRMMRERWNAAYLPNLPKKEGFHRFWCSSTHPTDTVARRIALGYRVLTLDDVKGTGWAPEQSSVKDASAPDNVVRWREMVGMECPVDLYLEHLREFHHDQPRDMVRDIYAPLEETADRVRESGGRVEFGEGFQEMARYRRQDFQFET